MAHYYKLENYEEVYVEQNIHDNNELESYESIFTMNGHERTSVLYYYEADNKRFYTLGLLENLNRETVTIVADDLSEIFKYKTAKTRRKHIYELLANSEEKIKSDEAELEITIKNIMYFKTYDNEFIRIERLDEDRFQIYRRNEQVSLSSCTLLELHEQVKKGIWMEVDKSEG